MSPSGASRQPGGPVRPTGVVQRPGDRQAASRPSPGAAADRARARRRADEFGGDGDDTFGGRAPRRGRPRLIGIPHESVPFRVRRRLARGENLHVAQHEHVVVLLPAVLVVVGGLVLIYALSSLTGFQSGVTSVLGLVWLGAVLWAVYKWWEYSVQWLVITDKRVMRIDGVIERVAMLPLPRLTDIAFEKTALGYVFGYGKFTLESAGQIQALREINYVADSDRTHAILTELLYRSQQDPIQDLVVFLRQSQEYSDERFRVLIQLLVRWQEHGDERTLGLVREELRQWRGREDEPTVARIDDVLRQQDLNYGDGA